MKISYRKDGLYLYCREKTPLVAREHKVFLAFNLEITQAQRTTRASQEGLTHQTGGLQEALIYRERRVNRELLNSVVCMSAKVPSIYCLPKFYVKFSRDECIMSVTCKPIHCIVRISLESFALRQFSVSLTKPLIVELNTK